MKPEYEIYAAPHASQGIVHRHPARFKVLAAGRRWGKTRLGVYECFETLSKGGRAWWVAPTYKMANVGWRPIHRMGVNIGAEIRKADRQVLYPGGGEISVRSADNPDSLRGEGLDKIILDECAFISEDAWTQSLRPALSDRKGAAIFISTPKGRNWFWRLYQKGTSSGNGWHSWQLPTSDNPFIDLQEIEDAREMLPELIFQQEYLAVFNEQEGTIFRRITECATANEIPAAEEGHQYIAAVDVATLVDFTAVCVMDTQTKEQVFLDRFNRVDYSVLEDRLEAIYRRFNLTSMTIEANSIGQSVIEEMVKRDLSIIPFTTTNATKMAAIQALQGGFEHGNIKILNDPVQIGELQAYEGQRTPSGTWKYGAPSGMHDDTVMALAICWQSISTPSGADLVGWAE